jgi:hypothetical protein
VRRLALLLVAVLAVLGQQAAAETRLALVIGVSTYDDPNIPSLGNTVADAAAIHDKLHGLGFQSTLVANPTKRALSLALNDLFRRRRTEAADIVLVFFAGHGLQFGNQGFLLARDSVIRSGAEMEAAEEVPVARLLRGVSEAKLAILFLDACRTTPGFAARLTRLSRDTVTTGLPQATQVRNAVISYAAEPGASALDDLPGTGHSPYTEALLDYMGRDGIGLGPMLQGVRRYVEAASAQRQKPEFADRRQPDSQFYFQATAEPAVRSDPVPDRVPTTTAGKLSPEEAMALLTGTSEAERGASLGRLLRDPGLLGPVSVDSAVALLGDIPIDGGQRRRLVSALLPLLDVPISPAAGEKLLAGLGETGRYAALLDMVGCFARPVPEEAARRLIEGIERANMPLLVRQLTSGGERAKNCGGAS